MPSWASKGRYREACSCDFLRPCIPRDATTPATLYDFFKVALTFENCLDPPNFSNICRSTAPSLHTPSVLLALDTPFVCTVFRWWV